MALGWWVGALMFVECSFSDESPRQISCVAVSSDSEPYLLCSFQSFRAKEFRVKITSFSHKRSGRN